MGYPVINPGVGAQSFWFFSFVPPEDLEKRKDKINKSAYEVPFYITCNVGLYLKTTYLFPVIQRALGPVQLFD